MKIRSQSVAALFLLAAGGAAWADEIRVPQDARTLQRALQQAGPGDTIVVKGEIRGNVTVAVRNVTIDGRNARMKGRLTIAAAGVEVSGIKFTGKGVDVVADDATLRQNRFLRAPVDVTASGTSIIGNEFGNSNGNALTIFGDDTLIADTQVVGPSGGGMFVVGDNTTIDNVVVEDTGWNSDATSSVEVTGSNTVITDLSVDGSDNSGVTVSYGSDATIENVTITDVWGDGLVVTDVPGTVVETFDVTGAGGTGVVVNSDEVTVTDGEITSVGGDFGILQGEDTVITDTTGEDADAEGFALEDGATGENLTSTDLESCGFLLGSDTTLKNSSATDCRGYGLYVAADGVAVSGCTIEGNAPTDILLGGRLSIFQGNQYGTWERVNW